MLYRPLPPEVIRRLLAGATNELSDLASKRTNDIKNFPCPRCGSAMQAHLHPRPFPSSDPLPRRILECVECAYAVDEVTGVVVALGNMANVDDPFDISAGQKK